MDAIASQITSLTIVYLTVYSDADQRKHQSSASLAFVWAIHRGPVNSPHKVPVTRKMSPFDGVIMNWYNARYSAVPLRGDLRGFKLWLMMFCLNPGSAVCNMINDILNRVTTAPDFMFQKYTHVFAICLHSACFRFCWEFVYFSTRIIQGWFSALVLNSKSIIFSLKRPIFGQTACIWQQPRHVVCA